MNSEKCNNKKPYSTEMEAYLALESIRTKGRIMDKTPIRSYKCFFCGKYHLTSQLKHKNGRRVKREAK